jgi:hypothetical protein
LRHDLTEELGGEFFLQRVKDDFDEGLEVGGLLWVLLRGGLEHGHGVVHGEGLHLGAGGGLPVDGHDGEAVGLAEFGCEADFALEVRETMLEEEPLEDGLCGGALVDVHAFDRLDLHATLEERGGQHGNVIADDVVAEENLTVARAVPREWLGAEAAFALAAVLVLSGPDAVAGVPVAQLPLDVGAGVGVGLLDLAEDFYNFIAVDGFQDTRMVVLRGVYLTTDSGFFFLNQSRKLLSCQHPGLVACQAQ